MLPNLFGPYWTKIDFSYWF